MPTQGVLWVRGAGTSGTLEGIKKVAAHTDVNLACDLG